MIENYKYKTPARYLVVVELERDESGERLDQIVAILKALGGRVLSRRTLSMIDKPDDFAQRVMDESEPFLKEGDVISVFNLARTDPHLLFVRQKKGRPIVEGQKTAD